MALILMYFYFVYNFSFLCSCFFKYSCRFVSVTRTSALMLSLCPRVAVSNSFSPLKSQSNCKYYCFRFKFCPGSIFEFSFKTYFSWQVLTSFVNMNATFSKFFTARDSFYSLDCSLSADIDSSLSAEIESSPKSGNAMDHTLI